MTSQHQWNLIPDASESLRTLFVSLPSFESFGTEWTSCPVILSGGMAASPSIALVFINPTSRNQSAVEYWDSGRAPFIGIARIWQILAATGIVPEDVVASLPKDQEWDKEVTQRLYDAVRLRGVYVTNLVKSCRSNPELPPPGMVRLFTPVLIEELSIVQPDWVVAMGGLVSRQLLGSSIRLSRVQSFIEDRGSAAAVSCSFARRGVIPCHFPVGRGNPRAAKQILSAVSEGRIERAEVSQLK